MPPPVQIADEDLEIAEDACRSNAARCRRQGSIEEAGRWSARPTTSPVRGSRDGRARPSHAGRLGVIFAFCDPCGRSTKLSTDRLVAVYGPEFTVQDLKRRLTCSKCGDRPREIRITYAVPSRRKRPPLRDTNNRRKRSSAGGQPTFLRSSRSATFRSP